MRNKPILKPNPADDACFKQLQNDITSLMDLVEFKEEIEKHIEQKTEDIQRETKRLQVVGYDMKKMKIARIKGSVSIMLKKMGLKKVK